MSSSTRAWVHDPLYSEGMHASQVGEWDRAEQAFTRLLEQYAGHDEAKSEIQPLLDDVRLRRSLDRAYAGKVAKARKRRPVGRIVLWMLIAAMAMAVVVMLATAQPAPAEPAAAPDVEATAEAQRQGLLQQVRSAVAAGRYTEALAILQDLLSRFPMDDEVKALVDWVNARWNLAVLYQRGAGLMGDNDWAGAVPVWQEILALDPAYRDAAAQLARARLGLEAATVWQEAEGHFSRGRWSDAAVAFENVRKLYPEYRRGDLAARLYQCYFNLGLVAVETGGGQSDSMTAAVDWFTRALTQRPSDQRATMERKLAQAYLPALAALETSRLNDAIALLLPIYEARYNYMNGTVAQMLYDAYMARGLAYEMGGDIVNAVADYAAAERITGPNTFEASQRRLALTMAMTPTPAPPTPTPFKWDASLLPPTVTPPPTPEPLSTYKGQIAFWTDREGVTQIFLMNPDGTNQRPANLARWGATEFEELRKLETISPDGRWQLYVARGQNRIAQIWITELIDGRPSANNKQITSHDNVAYDAVWSPDNYHIVFVSEHTGSDDIWIMTADGQNQRQLTKNEWEWEKHPSWSPDSSRIVFWSNLATGRQQIWVMNADGSNWQNLSNNEYNDWDPIWIK